MAAARFFSFSSAVDPLLHSASPAVGNGGHGRGFFRPLSVICPGQEPASHELSHDFDFQEGLTSVQALLRQHPKSNRGMMMTTVDHLKRLCIDHHFQDEIDDVVDSCVNLIHSDDLLEATLSMRLMREAGYSISADEVLQKFVNDNGDFNLAHIKDIRGLLSLQDMSQLNMGEALLYKAKDFSSKHLRWWMSLALAQEIPATRDQVLKWYMWPMTVLEGFSFSRYRIEIAKIVSLIYIVDDIFDVVATQEELSLFNEAIKRWDLFAADSLPSYMTSCYTALYTITNDIADMARKEHGSNPIYHLKKAWATLFDGFMIERKWISGNQVPRPEDYLRNGIITSGAPIVFLHLFFMLGHDIKEDKNDHIPRIISCSAKIMRLRDDMGSAKDEAQEGLDGSYKELYLRENPHGDAEENMAKMIAGEWEELNREFFSRTNSSLSPSFVGASLNFARMVSVMYGYNNEKRLPILDDYTRMLLL